MGKEMLGLARLLNEAPEHDPNRFGPAKSFQFGMPGVAPGVAQGAQLYLMNIAHSIASQCRATNTGLRSVMPQARSRSKSVSDVASMAAHPSWRQQEWEILLADTAKTLGLQQKLVQS